MRLAQNDGWASLGSYLHGAGFVLSKGSADVMLAEDDRNREVIRPLFTGQDLNSLAVLVPQRWVIDFGEMSEDQARAYPAPWRHVETCVRPERSRQDPSKYPRMVYEWWKHWNARPRLYSRMRSRDRVAVIARVSRTLMPTIAPADAVFTDKVVVFTGEVLEDLAVASSSLMSTWAIRYGTSMRSDPTFTPRAVSDTFPRPPLADISAAVEVATAYTKCERR